MRDIPPYAVARCHWNEEVFSTSDTRKCEGYVCIATIIFMSNLFALIE